MTAVANQNHHRWGDPDRSDPFLTLRVCTRCGMRKLTHHSASRHWITFASADGIAYHGEGTPQCFAVAVTHETKAA